MKKLVSLILALVLCFALCACGGNDSASVPVIGICQYGEHGSLDNCRTGFIQGLKDAGLVEGVDFEIDYQNASFDDNIDAQIAQSFAANNVALMCAIATPSAIACYAAAEEKDIPVIFTAISDPESAKLVGGNITGVSDKLPVKAQLQLIRALQPDAKTIGIVYTTSEANSVSTIEDYKNEAPAYGFEIEAIGVTSQAEVTQAVDNLINKGVDCFSNLTDNNVVGVLSSVLEKTNEAGIPVYGSEVEQVKLGCVASAGIDYVALGQMAGQMAAKVLKGEASASEMPYQTVEDFSNYINSAALKAMNITVPDSLADSVIEAE